MQQSPISESAESLISRKLGLGATADAFRVLEGNPKILANAETRENLFRSLARSTGSCSVTPESGYFVEELVKQGLTLGFDQLNEALGSGSLSFCKQLASIGANYSQTDSKQWQRYSLAHSAGYYGEVNNLERLRELGVDLLLKSPHGQTPAHLACVNGHKQVLEYYLETLRYPIEQIDSQENALMVLASGARSTTPAFREYLLSRNAKLNLDSGKLATTPLHAAASLGNFDSINHLLHLGADPSVTNQAGENFLHRLANYFPREMIKSRIRLDEATFDRLWTSLDNQTQSPASVATSRHAIVQLAGAITDRALFGKSDDFTAPISK